MEFIPYQKIIITTDLSTEEVIKRFRERVGMKKHENFVRVDKNIFSGQLIDNSFQLRLNTDYRNSWTPEINGTISEKINNTEVTVVLKSSTFVIIFTAMLMVIGLTWLIDELINIRNIEDFDWKVLPFLILPYGLCWLGFNLDADKSIDGLLKITKGELSNVR